MTLLFTFETVSAALDCEGILKKTGCPCRVIPVPRSLSASCVYAIRLETRPPAGGSADDSVGGDADDNADGRVEGKIDDSAGGDAGGRAGDPRAFCRELRARGAGFARVFHCTETGGRETYEEVLRIPEPLPARGNSGTG